MVYTLLGVLHQYCKPQQKQQNHLCRRNAPLCVTQQIQGYRGGIDGFSSASQMICMTAHPNNQQQVIPKVHPKVVAQMHKVILQQICVCNAPIPCVHLQKVAPKFALGHICMLDQRQDFLVSAAETGLLSAAFDIFDHLL